MLLIFTSLLISGLLLLGFLAAGAVLLVILNGFSETQAMPVIVGYGVVALGLHIGLTTLLTQWIAEHWLGSRQAASWTLLWMSVGSLVVELTLVIVMRAVLMKLRRGSPAK